jgi:hypothetical protein
MRKEPSGLALRTDRRDLYLRIRYARLDQRLAIRLPQIESTVIEKLWPIHEGECHFFANRIAARANRWANASDEIARIGPEGFTERCHRGCSRSNRAAAPPGMNQRDRALPGIGHQYRRTVRESQHQRLCRGSSDQNVAPWPRLCVSLDNRNGAAMNLVRREQIFSL